MKYMLNFVTGHSGFIKDNLNKLDRIWNLLNISIE